MVGQPNVRKVDLTSQRLTAWNSGVGVGLLAADGQECRGSGLPDCTHVIPCPSHPRIYSGENHQNSHHHWIGLREYLQETMVFTIKYWVFL